MAKHAATGRFLCSVILLLVLVDSCNAILYLCRFPILKDILQWCRYVVFPRTSSPSVAPGRIVSPTAKPTRSPDSTTMPTPLIHQLQCNGHENLCDLSVDKVLFATVHNAMTTLENCVPVLYNHRYSLEKALLAGYRGINVDVAKCQGKVVLVHEYCVLRYRNFVTVFQHIVNFLRDNPHEVIIVPVEIKPDVGGGSVSLDEIYAELELVPDLTTRYLYDRDPDATPSWPTLRELIEADTRLLFFHYRSPTRCRGDAAKVCGLPGMNDWFYYTAESQFQFDFKKLSQFQDKQYACQITRGLDGLEDFYGVNLFTDLPSLPACALVNSRSFLEDHIRQCSNITGLDVNLVIVNCWDEGDVLDVVYEYNAALVA
jgi:hypothetical protein